MLKPRLGVKNIGFIIPEKIIKIISLKFSNIFNYFIGSSKSCSYRALYIYRLYFYGGYSPELIYDMRKDNGVMHLRVSVKKNGKTVFHQNKINGYFQIFSI